MGSTRRAATWLLLVALVASLIGLGAPAGAQDGSGDAPSQQELDRIQESQDATLAQEPPSPPSPDDPFVALVDAQEAEATAATARVVAVEISKQADADLFTAAANLNVALDDEKVATTRRNVARAELATERRRLADLTVRAYVAGGELDVDQYRALVQGDTTDPSTGRKVMFEQVLRTQERVTRVARKDLSAAKAALEAATNRRVVAQIESDARTQIAADKAHERDDAVAAHEEAVADRVRAEDRLRHAPSGPVPIEVSLIGLPRLTAEDLAGWFRTTSYRPRVATPIEDYARWFIEEGRAEGIRGDIAFAQAVLETGGFANDDTVNHNNFSGIGHCDTCASGWHFSSPQMGVRAQIQLLKSYAVRKPTYAHDLAHPSLRGPSGCCPTWAGLTGVWATATNYAPMIMLIYGGIVDYALARRHAGQGFEPQQ